MRIRLWLAAGALLVTACDRGGRDINAPALQPAALGVEASATGGGHYDLAGTVVQFSFSAEQRTGGQAGGEFHIAFTDAGFSYDVHGAVICLSVDDVNHRAWIGGVVTRNETTDPDLQQDIHQPGRDVWFRVVDYGEGQSAADRTTFYGFEGAAGFLTSPEYCAGRPWPADDARTWPVLQGNISVRP
jgi:hypothetical protein